MTIFYLALILGYILALLARITSDENGRPSLFFSVILIIFLALISGLRNGIGDTRAYVHTYNLVGPGYNSNGGYEPGFIFILKVLKGISEDPQLMIFVFGVVTTALNVWIMRQYSKCFELSVFMYVASGFYLVTMNGIRQCLAGAILFAATTFIIKGRFNKKLQAIASQATGLSVLVVGLNTALTQLITQPCNSVLFVISLVVGGLIGTVINVEGRLQALGRWVEKKVGGRKGGVSRAFVTATLLYCVGSMAVVGSIESGLHHNYSILLTKSIMDMIYAVIIASTLGYGVIFSAVSVFIYQGAITILAGIVEPYLTGDIMREIALVGGVLITGLGIDLLNIRKINVGNLLPALLIPVFYYGIYYIIF